MFQYVALTDGTTLLNLTDGVSYDLVSYAPGAGTRNQNDLGPLYSDIEDTLTFHAIGFTPADAYAAVDAVNLLVDQAWRWAHSEPVAAVRLLIQLQGTTLALPLEVAIKGRAPDSGSAPLAVPEQPTAYAGKYVIQDVTITFLRRGQLLYPTAETGTYSAAAAAPTVHTITLSTPTTLSSPTLLQFEYSQAGVIDNYNVEYAYALTASAASRLQIYEAESMSLGTNVASVADAAAFARGGSVARYSPGVLSTTLTGTLVGFDTTVRTVAIWAAVRNNSATTNFTIQAQAGSNTGVIQSAPIVPIDTSTTNPRLIFLGIIAFQLAFDGVNLLLTASAASGTFDIDYIVIQAVDDEASGAVRVFGTDGAGTALTGQGPLTIDPRPLTFATPIITSVPNSITTPLSYAGNPVLYTRGSFVALLMGKNPGNFWRIVGGVSVVDSRVLSVARYGAYLTPR